MKNNFKLTVLIVVCVSLFACTNPVQIFPLDKTNIEFVSIPQGSFEMGAPLVEQGSSSYERPTHTVIFDYDFEMMTTEVTQGMWIEIMESNPSTSCGVGGNYPVYYIRWNDCQEFIAKLNEMDPSHTYRLPSESEWEYCCRAGSTTRFYWGEDSSEIEINAYAWWSGNSVGTTHPVAEKLPNDWGLYDMSGNVYEWCADKWHSDYTNAPTDGSAWVSGTRSGYVRRGGCWYGAATRCRSAFRHYGSPNYWSNNLGFRLVRTEN